MSLTLAAATALAGGAQAAGGLINTGLGFASQGWSQQFNSAEAQKQRDWQTVMSNTQYQRSVNDMRAAGLNPGAIGANGAGTPSGAAAHSGATASGRLDFSNLFSSAVSFAMAKDKNLSNQIVQEMKSASAREVQQMRTQGQIAIDAQREQGKENYYRLLRSRRGF